MDIYSGENSTVNLSILIGEISKNLKDIESDDKNFKYADDFDTLSYEIKDFFQKIQGYYENIYVDDESILILQDKFNLLNELKRKYKKDKKGLIDYKNSLEEEIFTLENANNLLEKEIIKLKNLKDEYISLANEISELRRKTAKRLENQIEKELLDLDLKNSVFKIEVIKTNKIMNIGFDMVKFLISTNKGEELKEIYKVASGGELSRIMLGFKKVLSDRDKISTLIFDEIDSGISGITAQIVGEKLVEISKNHQLIVISHLPQISSLSDTHYITVKEVVGDSTVSKVIKADYNQKIMEISRIIGGSNINDVTVKQSEEMVKIADELKGKLR